MTLKEHIEHLIDEVTLTRWVNGEMKLMLQETVVYKKAESKDLETDTVYATTLSAMNNYEEAKVYMAQLKLNKTQLKELAKS